MYSMMLWRVHKCPKLQAHMQMAETFWWVETPQKRDSMRYILSKVINQNEPNAQQHRVDISRNRHEVPS